jgi:hypothetical protein
MLMKKNSRRLRLSRETVHQLIGDGSAHQAAALGTVPIYCTTVNPLCTAYKSCAGTCAQPCTV